MPQVVLRGAVPLGFTAQGDGWASAGGTELTPAACLQPQSLRSSRRQRGVPEPNGGSDARQHPAVPRPRDRSFIPAVTTLGAEVAVWPDWRTPERLHVGRLVEAQQQGWMWRLVLSGAGGQQVVLARVRFVAVHELAPARPPQLRRRTIRRALEEAQLTS